MDGPFDSHREKFRQLLRQARSNAGLRQADLAARLSRPQSFVSKYESGERRLDLVEVWEICCALGLSLRDLAKQFEEAIDEA